MQNQTAEPAARFTPAPGGELAALDSIAAAISNVEPSIPRLPALALSKSTLATLTDELRVRVRERIGHDPWPQSNWRELAGMCLATNLNARAILNALGTIGQAIYVHDHPPAIVPPPPMWLELARDIGAKLSDVRETAGVELERALAKLASDHPRARAAWVKFVGEFGHGDVTSLAKTLRFALAGFGLPAVRRGSLFGDAPPKLQPVPAIREYATSEGPQLKELLDSLAPLFGVDPRTAFEHEAATGEHRDALDAQLTSLQRRRDLRQLANGDAAANEAEYKRQAAKLNEDALSRARAMHMRYAHELETVRARIAATADRVLAELERREPGSLRALYARDLLVALSRNSSVPTLFGPRGETDYAVSAARWLRDAGVSLEAVR